jgi:hypothetical protein
MKYRAKPIEVEAVKWDGTSEAWGTLCSLVEDDVVFRNPDDTLSLEVNDAHVRVRVGNWIAKGEFGFTVIDDEVFTSTYEPVLELGKGAENAAD